MRCEKGKFGKLEFLCLSCQLVSLVYFTICVCKNMKYNTKFGCVEVSPSWEINSKISVAFSSRE